MSNKSNLIEGIWVNEYGSIMTINLAQDGIFNGVYSSTTGDSGTYKVVGVYDSNPAGNEQTVSFAVSWRNINKQDTGTVDQYSHSCSSFSGQIQHKGTSLIMMVIHILTSPNKPADTWKNSLVDKLTFVKKEKVATNE